MNRCQNCDWVGSDELLNRKLEDIPHLLERVSPGEPLPSGECPECGALCQPTGNSPTWVVRIPVMVTADDEEEAKRHALDDLRDPEMEWDTFEVEQL